MGTAMSLQNVSLSDESYARKNHMKFKRNYFYLTILLFFIEVSIAIFINDRFVHLLIGDVLAIALIYCSHSLEFGA